MRGSTLPPRPPQEFADIPFDRHGHPLTCIADAESYHRYIEWLADYLYRRTASAHDLALPLEAAWSQISSIEAEIAFWIWEHPFEDYPADNYQLRHADVLHRARLSEVLSRVASHEDRVELLDRFYRELEVDVQK
jgi:hypothetical protein